MRIDIAEWVVKIPVLLFAITIHEYAHGKAALSLGDPTAKNAGRLTLNPLSHIDPMGAMIESLAIYVLVVVLIILFRNPLIEYLVQ